MYQPVAANIDIGDAHIEISQTSLYEEARKSNCVNFV